MWATTFALVFVAVIAGRLVNIIPLPYPASTPVSDINPRRIPSPSTLLEMCGKAPLQAQRLHQAVRLFEGKVHGSETVAVAANGSVFMLDTYGYLFRADKTGLGGAYELEESPVTYIGPGRPLGFSVDGSGNLLVAHSLKGLTEISGSTLVSRQLANQLTPPSNWSGPRFANDVDIAADGTVYFSITSLIAPPWSPSKGMYDLVQAFVLNMVKGEPSGQVLSYSPDSGVTTVVGSGLWFANGLALSSKGEWLVVAETCSMRLSKLWLKGDKAGQLEVFLERLPGFPDGVARSTDGNFWVTIVSPPLPALALRNWGYKALRLLVGWLPENLLPLGHVGLLMKVSPEGQVLDCLVDEDGHHIAGVSAVTEVSGRLFLGNVGGDYISYYDLPEPKH